MLRYIPLKSHQCFHNIVLIVRKSGSGISTTFKLTEVEPDVFQWICSNPKDIPPDDLDDEILDKMAKEADAMYNLAINQMCL